SRFECEACLTALDDTVLHRWGDEKADRQRHKDLACAIGKLGRPGELFEGFLKDPIELESEQHLRAQDEQAPLVERGLCVPAATHSSRPDFDLSKQRMHRSTRADCDQGSIFLFVAPQNPLTTQASDRFRSAIDL